MDLSTNDISIGIAVGLALALKRAGAERKSGYLIVNGERLLFSDLEKLTATIEPDIQELRAQLRGILRHGPEGYLKRSRRTL